ncbi:cytochrome c3 family protein [Anaeromyxobacter paludicola]|uniref:Doubled CXXCH motif domain-containing protein n=1 Tax=Anaeromyxobacter paludicola TaxID=2918171 RepID=A0ABM7XBH1_9BACT|nr:cytochrome c3 family protein [Anaeromyxobacter paludicola]BDG09213.1 hypothetical protein AMPC_23260 [Anaeromyxobacter paludicola]
MSARAVVICFALSAPWLAFAKSAPPAPLDWGANAASKHAPYAAGDCAACHEKKGPHPGAPAGSVEQLCLAVCHSDLRAADHRGHAFRHCTRCHNAHDSKQLHLLRAEPGACPECHQMNAGAGIRRARLGRAG